MKEKKTLSQLRRILANCTAQAKEYGACVAAKIPEVERDMCLKEFLALKTCMQNTVFSWKTAPFSPNAAPNIDSITEGPICSIRFSLDENCSPTVMQPGAEALELLFHRLDLFAYDNPSKSLALVETKKMAVSWYAYRHEIRLLLLASGMQCKSFHGFQLSSAGIIRLPKFEMGMAKPKANSKPVLASEDVYIVTVYGRIYCLQVDRVSMVLHSYRFYRDAIIQQGSLPIYSSKVAVSVVDNVLLVHQVDAKAISVNSSEVPSVLEFLQRRKLEANKAKQLCLAITQTMIIECRPITMVAKAMDVLVTSYALSLKNGSYFKGIKTERTSLSVSNVSGPGQGIDVNTGRTDGLGKSVQHESASRVNSVSVSAESSTTHNPLNASVSEQQESHLTSPAISPDEMYKFVFVPIKEEMIGEPSYLVSIILELFRSANLEKVKVHPNLFVLTIQLLACSGQYAELGLFVINKVYKYLFTFAISVPWKRMKVLMFDVD
ncbi:hypothetical protein F3Y22_tig00110213pilonHSYRG00023 [Hibiscus syriacus]|uniref:Mic1 domain-containing protein n=1 Tax=Hibiscus syriacus TaxID=106335 RepID=A0A6A3B9U4_HIBSY|nr:hypothetical protein F3Y22_tig00110213pilonHSYRG00023 [Hibiscus syriacus]